MIKLAIDLGSSITKIYRVGNGVVLAEPTLIAVEGEKVKAVGEEAKALLGRAPEGIRVIAPVKGGVISDAEKASAMLVKFLEKIEIKRGRRQSVHAVFSVPCGSSSAVVSGYYRVADEVGFGKISFVETPYLSALGLNAPISEGSPVLSVDIGGELINAAVLSLDGIIVGFSAETGGKSFDDKIAEHIRDKYSLSIGVITREEVKNQVGSLFEGDGKSKVIRGRMSTGHVGALNVTSADVALPIANVTDRIAEYIELMLKRAPTDILSSVYKTGIYLSGGVSVLEGLREYLEDRLGIDVHLYEESPYASILGAGKLLEKPELLKRIKIKY